MKKGEISLSFGMIISIIIIVAILAVAFYAIRYFLNLKDCTELGLYAKDIQTKIDDAWNSDISKDVFSAALPSKVKSVCFGNITSQASSWDEYDLLKNYQGRGNMFYYPPSSCDLKYTTLKHVNLGNFFCVKTSKGKATVKIEKNSQDSLVTLRP